MTVGGLKTILASVPDDYTFAIHEGALSGPFELQAVDVSKEEKRVELWPGVEIRPKD